MDIFAHSLPDDPSTERWETLRAHSLRVAALAEQFAAVFGAAHKGRALGLLHDIGKCSAAYQDYIRKPGPCHGPDHSTAGARAVVASYGPLGRLLAFAIAGHHSGLMDGSGHDGPGRSLNERLDEQAYAVPASDNWPDYCPARPTLQDLVDESPPVASTDYPGFATSFFVRMLFSCLTDADFIATEGYYAESAGLPPPARGGTITQAHLDAIRRFMKTRRRDDTPLNRLRSRILDHAIGKAALGPGLFTMTVPTGGGKTLASLSFALDHAVRHGLRRVIYVIPFTSIIEQTATVFREALGTTDGILEHHSNFDWDRRAPAGENDEEAEGADGLAKLRRDAENWDAPIIVTTSVQFFESLFAARGSQARKLHNIAGSVIILDEVQTLPLHLLRPCLAVLDELARNYGVSIVLCTATQSALRQIDDALPPGRKGRRAGLDIQDTHELAPEPAALYDALRRATVTWRKEPVSDGEIAARFAVREQMLCIVNTRAHAHDLFTAIADQDGARHLTTLMCPLHRRATLVAIRQDLKNGRPVRLVSTSLIEAGVDVDFPEVWREATGLSSITQAAGRCNREGRLDEPGPVVVFETPDPADPTQPWLVRAMRPFWQATRPILRQGLDPLSLEAIHAYFRELYFQHSHDTHGHDGLDAARIGTVRYAILEAIAQSGAGHTYPYATIARAFRMIDTVMESVIIPWDETVRQMLHALDHAPVPPAGFMRRLQQYCVPVPAPIRLKLLAAGALRTVKPEAYGDRFVYLESMDLYDARRGLKLDDPTFRHAESNVW
ncbi:metal dependent phosphohydrolase [Gluconacetobacter diazotrophicus PA1 5]|uniref:CRISPR-associated endonuclease Cas3 n=2 Tax=Gluconacetobacter diazotrophicus TaxID=33996 RepID=A0A7W4NGF2_GLUDI|nr:CRISPR-associated endonuclease Cas3'' [Gluconacetobacter diazotrophicus]ACI51404.1 metal dependent phosphohydrolase [Gluconacetobacter diazotrophicus PA1 5]MBB2157286.1 CRISPR-associated endonuclease Cas3'' [Gluconacetobacter diazotrophicus]TWA98261.1 CRISPR-associated Cas3 family helicase [Gluconacetobacter diazotrophicus]CAP54009.1 putative helicase protein [Gluconacetobacter diazotrophicus PA1 5]